MRPTVRRLLSLALAVLAPAVPRAATPFQFEVLGASTDWLVLRENVPVQGDVAEACRYPGIDPSEFLGARVHFVRLSEEAKRGRLTPFAPAEEPMPLFTPTRGPSPCTSRDEGRERWARIVARAGELGIDLASGKALKPVTVGAAVPDRACVLLGGGEAARACRREFDHAVRGQPLRIGVLLTAVPEAPDLATCQLSGLRLGAAVQVTGLDFGQIGASAPGGFATHHDCRSQQLDPLRLYAIDGGLLVVGSFRGTSLADRGEYPFFVIARGGHP